MAVEKIHTLVIGAGQAGLATSEHLSNHNIPHLILERTQIVESWRNARWDSLVANGPAWHDRFPSKKYSDAADDEFPSKASVVKYFEEFAEQIKAPIRCGVNVFELTKRGDGSGYKVTTSAGVIEAKNVVVATGAFQCPLIPAIIPDDANVTQIHSYDYKNPSQMADGAVMVIGAGSSGTQIAEELRKAGRDVYLCVGPHDRPPRRYRGKDNVWWLGVLGKWEMKVPAPNTEHVTIAVSGVDGGKNIDFRNLANNGITLLGKAESFQDNVMMITPDLTDNIIAGDKNYLGLLNEADDYIAKNNLDFPEEPEAHVIKPASESMVNPILEVDFKQRNINSVIWATGFKHDFSWIKLDIFEESGKPKHQRGVSVEQGIYFIGLPWLSMRGSSFIWGVWKDAKYLAEYIASKT